MRKLISTNVQLRKKEIIQFAKVYESEFYDMASEYIWNRAISILRSKVLDLGEEFVFEMLGRTDFISSDEIQSYDVIILAHELGFINKTQKLLLTTSYEYVKHFSSRDCDDEMSKTVSDLIIENSLKSVLSRDNETLGIKYNDFRNRLKQEVITQDGTMISIITDSPYFYKRTITKTLLNLLKSCEGAELDIVCSNVIEVIPLIWEDLLTDDRYPIGIAYAEAVNHGNKKSMKNIKSLLLKVHGFDYVPENLRSNTFRNVATKLISVHNGFNNFYNEPSVVRELEQLGKVIPAPAFPRVMTAVLCVKLGNNYGVSGMAQVHADGILDKITEDKWKFYLEKVFIGDTEILYKLKYQEIFKRWVELVNKYDLNVLEIGNSNVVNILNGDRLTAKVKGSVDKLINTIEKGI